MPASPVLPDEQARELAREILSRPEYAVHRRPRTRLQETIDGLAEWIRNLGDYVPAWMVDLWDSFWATVREMFGYALGDDALVVVIRLAVAVLVLGAFTLMVLRVIRDLRERRAEPEEGVALPSDAEPEWIAEAEVFAREGRFVEAAHCTQVASLQLLLRKRWLELERSEPNRTLRRRLAAAHLPNALRGRFVGLLDRLEGRWFRDRVEDRDLYTDWRVLHAEIAALPEGR
jgi:hypothetical protein